MKKNSVLEVRNISKRYRVGSAPGAKNRLSPIIDFLISPYQNFRKLDSLSNFEDYDDATAFWALKDINFELEQGDILGIMGPNGSGKSTLLKILSRIVWSTSGEFSYRGRMASLLEVGTGFNGELTGRDNIYLNGAILGMKRGEIDKVYDEIVDFSGVERFIDTPVKRYSSGMTVRLAFSVAAHLDPDILVLDEVLSVGDAQFSQKSVEKMEKVALSGRTVVFVSHSVTAVQKLCKRAILLNEGNIVLEGSVKDVTQRYLGENISERTNADWSNEASPEEAGVVKLLSVSIKDENLNTIGFGNDEGARLNISKGLLVEVTYELLTVDRNVYVELTFNNDAHTVLFTAVQPPVKSPLLGINTATVEIPGDFFAEGKIFVSVGFIENAPHSRFIYQENLLHFDVYDPLNGTSIRTHYGAPVPGLIRPSLKWSINDAKRKKS